MKSRCKTLHIDLQLETLALPEKERSEERGALFRPLLNGGRGGGGLSLSRFASVLRFCLHARCTSAAGRGGLAPCVRARPLMRRRFLGPQKESPRMSRLSPKVSSVNSLWRRFQETCGDSPAFRKQPWSRSGFRVLIAAAARRGRMAGGRTAGGRRAGGRRADQVSRFPTFLPLSVLRPSSPFLRSSEAPTRSTCIGLDRIGEERGGRDCALTYLLSQSAASSSFDSRFARGRHSPPSLCRSFKTLPWPRFVSAVIEANGWKMGLNRFGVRCL